jgi:hypothetical protein
MFDGQGFEILISAVSTLSPITAIGMSGQYNLHCAMHFSVMAV